jgi:PAS domain S-box-containing protein
MPQVLIRPSHKGGEIFFDTRAALFPLEKEEPAMPKPTCEELEQKVRDLEKQAAEWKRFEEKERLEKERAQKYLDIAGVAIVALNERGEVTLINKRGCEILEYREEEVLGKRWFDHFLPARNRQDVATVFEKLLAGEIDPVEHYENPVLTKAGEERMIAWYNTLIRDETGKPTGTLSSGEDITERLKAEAALRRAHEELSRFSKELEAIIEERSQELREKNEQLVEAERLAALGRIANRVAHDLRNPLTVIGGFTRRLFEKTLDGDSNKKYLRIILQEVMNLESRVSEIIRMGQEEEK